MHDPLAEMWFYETPSFFPPQTMPSVAMATASLDAYMFDEEGRFDFAVRATEYVALGEVAHAIQPRAFWYELTARQLRPMVLSGAVRIFYVAEVGPVDEGYEADPKSLDWEDFVHPVGDSRCDLCNDPLPPGEGVHDWAGTDMHVCEHHELALSSVVTLGMLVGVATGAHTGSSASGRRLQWLLMLSHMVVAEASATATKALQ